jgi:ATP-dependent helicase/nuclease subunit B
MFNLVCVPLGTSAAPVFFKEAAGFEYKKTLLITSTRNLVQAGRAAGLNTANFDYLANAILRQAQIKTVRKISRTAQELIVTELIKTLQEQGQLPYFEALAAKPGFIKAMTSLLSQFGRSGVTVDEVTEAFKYWEDRDETHQEKDQEVARLYQAYREYLKKHHLFDVEGLYRLALAAVTKPDFTSPWEHLYFYGFYEYDALQLEIIQALSKISQVKAALVYENNRPHIFAATETTFGELVHLLGPSQKVNWVAKTTAKSAPLTYLTANLRREGASVYQDAEHPEAVTEAVQLWETLDQEQEQALVLRQVKSRLLAGVQGKDIAIIVRNLENYTGFRRLCDAYGIPTLLPQATTLATTPLAEYVLSFLRLGQGYGRDQAVAILDFLCLPLQELLLGIPINQILAQSRLNYVQEAAGAWHLALQAVPQNREALMHLQEQAAALPKQATLAVHCQFLSAFLQELQVTAKAGAGYRDGRLNMEAFKSLACAETALQEICRQLTEDARSSNLVSRNMTSTDFIHLVEEKAQSMSLLLEAGSTAGINILAATEVEGLNFPYVYVLGLREHEFPSLQTENWIYDDNERGALRVLGLDVPGSQKGYAEDALFFATACAAATSSLVCSYAPDEQEGASPYVDDLVTLLGDKIKLVRTGSVPAAELASVAEYKHFWAERGNRDALRQFVEPEFLAAAAADADRSQAVPESSWNGTVTAPELLPLVQKKIGVTFSASKLEGYLNCPFQFLYTYVWGQGEPNPAEENIRPDVQGSLLHSTLEKFLGAHLGQHLRFENWEKLLEELDMVFTGCCQEFVQKNRIVSAEFWEADRLQVLRILHRWLRSELAYSAVWQYRPAAVEAKFGGAGENLTFPLTRKTLSLTGRIDRLDQEGHQYFITDYKTSLAPAAKEFLHSNLQLPLYMWAAQTYLQRQDHQAQVVGGGYFVLKKAERKSSVALATCTGQFPFTVKTDLDEQPLTSLEQLQTGLAQVLEQELTSMDQGLFAPQPGKQCDKYCPAWDICRLDVLKKAATGEDEDA